MILRRTRNIVHSHILDPGDLIPKWYTIISGMIAIVWVATTPGGGQASAPIPASLERSCPAAPLPAGG